MIKATYLLKFQPETAVRNQWNRHMKARRPFEPIWIGYCIVLSVHIYNMISRKFSYSYIRYKTGRIEIIAYEKSRLGKMWTEAEENLGMFLSR